VAKYIEGTFLLFLEVRAECRDEFAHVWGRVTQQHCGESYTSHCLGETGRELKLTVF
jgi:hypothetical protein